MAKRIILLLLLAVVVLLAVGTGSMYWAVTSVQPHYIAALEEPPEALEESSRKLENRFTTLSSDLQSAGEWRTVLSAKELNGWLAYKLPESFPDLLPEEIRDPRVSITPQEVILAARSEIAGVDTVVSVMVEPFVTEQGDLAIELRHVLAGVLPVPTKEIVDRLAYSTRRAQLPIRWTQNNGNTVMVIARELWDTEQAQHRTLEAIELSEGELYLTGRTEKVDTEKEEHDPAELEATREIVESLDPITAVK